MTSPVSRRRALGGAATLGVAAPILAACGDNSGTASDPAGSTTSAAPTTAPAAPTTTTDSGTTSAPVAGGGLVATTDVPVGGGVILKADELVVTQPKAGEFKAFSAICTHQGCLVSSVSDGQIVCACHQSHFSIGDGTPQSGPASSRLPEVSVQIVDGQVEKS